MTDNPHTRSAAAQVLLALRAPMIRMSLLEEADFCEELGIERDRLVVFGDSGSSFNRTELYNAIRQVLSDETEIVLTDAEGKDWRLVVKSEESQSRVIQISHNDYMIDLLPYWTLSPDSNERLCSVNEVAHEFNLPASSRDAWREKVSERPLDDDEVDEFFGDFCDTPIHVASSIRNGISNGSVSGVDLVPRSRRYYDRLIGAYDDSESIGDYAADGGRRFFGELASWRPFEGFLHSLLLSSDSTLTAEIRVERLESEDLVRALDFLEKCGDRLSQLGAIEVGLRVLPEVPEIEPSLMRLIKQIRDDTLDGPESRFRLLSTLFFFVDGELSRARLFSQFPPFYRRLASLAQSALISRQFLELGVGADPFCEWVIDKCGMNYVHFCLQSLVDLRREPRWIPEFVTASQLKGAFLSRIIEAALDCEEALGESELDHLILGTDSDCLSSHIGFPHFLTVGPLEGGEDVSKTTPPFVLEEIEAQFTAEGNGAFQYVRLIRVGPLLLKDSAAAELAAKALRRDNHRLGDFEDKTHILKVLNGLASVAAVTRSRSLADELRILVRKHSRDAQYALSSGEAVAVFLAAAASRSNLEDWREFVGNFLTEMAYGELGEEDRGVLHMNLHYLCHVDPGLWAYCSRADAALKALKGF